MSTRPGQKLFYKIGEVGSLAGVEPYILRYWESEFPKLAPRKNKGGQRVYRQRDLELVLTIKRMLHEEGYTIAGARKKLGEQASKPAVVENAQPEAVSVQADAGDVQTVEDRVVAGDAELAGKLASLKKDIKEVLDFIK